MEWTQGIAASVQAGDWSTDSDVVLDESCRLFDAEIDRRKGADAKAGIYLAAITALIGLPGAPRVLSWKKYEGSSRSQPPLQV